VNDPVTRLRQAVAASHRAELRADPELFALVAAIADPECPVEALLHARLAVRLAGLAPDPRADVPVPAFLALDNALSREPRLAAARVSAPAVDRGGALASWLGGPVASVEPARLPLGPVISVDVTRDEGVFAHTVRMPDVGWADAGEHGAAAGDVLVPRDAYDVIDTELMSALRAASPGIGGDAALAAKLRDRDQALSGGYLWPSAARWSVTSAPVVVDWPAADDVVARCWLGLRRARATGVSVVRADGVGLLPLGAGWLAEVRAVVAPDEHAPMLTVPGDGPAMASWTAPCADPGAPPHGAPRALWLPADGAQVEVRYRFDPRV
jgi:hypothetical protein